MMNLWRNIKTDTALCGKVQKRSSLDRRTDQDRRQAYHIKYFDADGTERRKYKSERRQIVEETRVDWARVCPWVSVCVNPSGLYYKVRP